MDSALGAGSEDQVESVCERRWFLLAGGDHLGVVGVSMSIMEVDP